VRWYIQPLKRSMTVAPIRPKILADLDISDS
jgi:hypothetical protein